MSSMSSLKCVRSLIPVDTFSACHPSKRLCPGVRQLSGMDGATIGKSAAAKAAVLNHIKVLVFLFDIFVHVLSLFILFFYIALQSTVHSPSLTEQA